MNIKLLFYNFNNILESNNIKIEFHKLNFVKKIYQNKSNYCIYKFKNLHTYYSLLNYENKNYLFFKLENKVNNKKIDNTYFTESSNYIFNDKINLLGDFQCSSHNMSFFLNKDNKIFAIGGKCNSKESYKKKKLPDYGENFYIKVGNKNIIDPNLLHPHKANGLYLYSFNKNSKNLDLVYKKPVVIYTDLFDKKYDGVASLDSHICCFYDNKINMYRLYCRANLYRGIRSIQTSISNDLIKWEKFKLLNFTPNFNKRNDNYYCISCSNYLDSNYYIGISPYFTKNSKFNKDGLYLLFSEDGYNWIRCNKILEFDRKYINAPVYGVVNKLKRTNNLLNFYIDFTKVINNSQYVAEYNICIDRFSSLFSISDKEGFVMLKKISDSILINFKTHENGYIKIDNKILKGDHIDYKVNISNLNEKFKIVLLKSQIYSITFI
jgi:hypothetical protein